MYPFEIELFIEMIEKAEKDKDNQNKVVDAYDMLLQEKRQQKK